MTHEVRQFRISARAWIAGALVALCAAGTVLLPTKAAVAPSPSPGNLRTGTMVVGGQTVQYAYTEHLSPNGTFRIRLNGGVYNTGSIISYIVHGLPAFSSWDKYANPGNGAVFLPEEDVNPGRTAYERRDSDGCSSCIVDQVMAMTYSGLPAGTYAFSVTVIQNGDTGGQIGLPLYVDAAAPDNTDESDAWAAIPGMDLPCADGFDNDLSYAADCADAMCAGSVGRVGDGAMCESPESTCYDEFDNDADGYVDCLDPDCDGRVGRLSDGAICQYQNEFGAATCGDGFDNDGDTFTDCVDYRSVPAATPALTCWKQPAYGCPATETSCTDGVDNDKDKSYDDAWDDAPLTGRDCTDYDCAGDPACPSQENRTAGGDEADAQCFNTVPPAPIDDDLDHLSNCADPDCLGVVNPGDPTQICYEKEFDLGQRYQFCGNAFDDDGDGPADCADSDCSRRFGSCGPCPDREDFTYDSCADGKDNDTDGGANCSDPDADCDGRLGTLGDAARCAAAESAASVCFDGFDNDNDGLIDCADTGCAGQSGPGGRTCALAEGGALCSEPVIPGGFDNDADGRINCVDPGCYGTGDCAPRSWIDSACRLVPRSSGFSSFTSNNATVTASVTVASHVGSFDVIRIKGTGTYTSFTVIIGDNTDPAAYYPYADPTCTLTGTGASKLSFTTVAGHVAQIYNNAGETIAGLDVTFSCPTPSVHPVGASYPIGYPVSLSALKSPGGIPEYGDLNFQHTLYEATAPSVTEVEAEGENAGTLDVPRGGERRFRAVPNDPGTGLETTGICGCTVRVDSIDHLTPDSECVTEPMPFVQDAVISLSASAEDGANNIGAYGGGRTLNINVTPVVDEPLAVTPGKPFFNTTYPDLGVRAAFLSANNNSFGAACAVYIRDISGNIVNGPVGPTMQFVGFPLGNSTRCEAGLDLTTLSGGLWPVPDGEYFVTVRVTDDDGDSIESNRKVMYVCNSVPRAGDTETVCSWADFDRDGHAEGLYTSLYSTAPKACDNCVGLANPLQTDENANGVGDACEPNDLDYGRCEYDRDIVCQHDSDEIPPCPGDLCCPAPSIAPPNADPQYCRDPWGLCSLGGEYCFEDSECPGGDGLCSDGTTLCRRDIDCENQGASGPCVGADICDNLVFPWLETVHGNIFSQKKILAPDTPPQGRFNATYCISAGDTVLNFHSELCTAEGNSPAGFRLPERGNSYSSVLGRIDVAGLKAGKYGPVTLSTSSGLDAALDAIAGTLGGKVIVVQDGGDAVVTAKTVFNAAMGGGQSGAGTVLIDGGDLYIRGDFGYAASTVTALSELASLGWIIVPDADGLKGNVYIEKTVSSVIGSFFVGGEEGVYTVAPPDIGSETPLTVSGLMIARKFHLSRSLKSLERGAEQVIYDGRAVANPPPGFGDIRRSLPLFSVTR